jgi:hypothetical protein
VSDTLGVCANCTQTVRLLQPFEPVDGRPGEQRPQECPICVAPQVFPAPEGLGTVLVYQVDGRPLLDRADPITRIAYEALDLVERGESAGLSLTDSELTVAADNATAVYRLHGSWRQQLDAWRAGVRDLVEPAECCPAHLSAVGFGVSMRRLS